MLPAPLAEYLEAMAGGASRGGGKQLAVLAMARSQLPRGSLLRSEPMCMLQLIVQHDAAQLTVEELGEQVCHIAQGFGCTTRGCGL